MLSRDTQFEAIKFLDKIRWEFRRIVISNAGQVTTVNKSVLMDT